MSTNPAAHSIPSTSSSNEAPAIPCTEGQILLDLWGKGAVATTSETARRPLVFEHAKGLAQDLRAQNRLMHVTRVAAQWSSSIIRTVEVHDPTVGFDTMRPLTHDEKR